MKIECTIRFENPSRDGMERTLDRVLLQKELKTVKTLLGGFYFHTERSPIEILNELFEEGFDMSDFANIEFKPV